MEIKEIEKKYKGEWVLAEVLKEDKIGQPTKVKIIAHSKDRSEIYGKLSKSKSKKITTFYAGKIPSKGYAVAF